MDVSELGENCLCESIVVTLGGSRGYLYENKYLTKGWTINMYVEIQRLSCTDRAEMHLHLHLQASKSLSPLPSHMGGLQKE